MVEGAAWAALLVGAAVTYFWRALGVALAGRLDTASPAFDWIACVAYALLAGLIARMIVFPVGPLAETKLDHRLLSAAVALAIFFLRRRSIFWGAAAGVASLALLTGSGD